MPIDPQGEGWWLTRGGKILLLGLAALLLQQVAAPYTASLAGLTADASLLHLHYGLLLAIAMLERDRWVLVGVMVVVTGGWLLRALASGYDMDVWLPLALLLMPVQVGWLLLCAWWMGYPAPSGRARVSKRRLARFALFGLLVYPVGGALISLLGSLTSADTVAWLGTIQTLFARYFGVAVLTFPLVMVWSGDHGLSGRILARGAWLWPLGLGLCLVLSVLVGEHLRTLVVEGSDQAVVLMDYRFALFALLAWCVLRLRLRASMLVLSLVLFAWVQVLTGTAERNGTALGFINLVYLAFEVAVLLMAMLYFAVFERDGREFGQRMEEEARRDAITGLPNLNGLRHEIKRPGVLPPGAELGFLLLDHTDDLVVGFGLDIQAEVMKAVAARLEGTARPFVVGMGQFALLPVEGRDVDWDGVADAVEMVEIDSDGHRFGLSPYLGVARRMGGAPGSLEEVVRQASQQAFEARRHSEVRPLHADDDAGRSGDAMRQTLRAATDALAGIRSGRLELHFQPIRPLDPAHPGSASPDHAVGEILCRLRDGHDQLKYPDSFIEPIEAVGRSVELDLAVLRTLFEQLREYPAALPGIRRMAVNLTGHSLVSTSFRRQFELLLADSPLLLSALCFEITEAAAISATPQVRGFLDELRRHGCRIALDDFGTGVQGFSRLKDLPVDILKIDGSFVRHVTQRGPDHALVEASVSIARAFDLETVAEFVETEDVAQVLRELGVQWMQGYLYARPRPLAEVLAAAAAAAMPQSGDGSDGPA